MSAPKDEPPMDPTEELYAWRDMYLNRQPGDPIHQWARRRLIKAGLLADEPEAPRGPVLSPADERRPIP
jgi:hypothetical protein